MKPVSPERPQRPLRTSDTTLCACLDALKQSLYSRHLRLHRMIPRALVGLVISTLISVAHGDASRNVIHTDGQSDDQARVPPLKR